MMKKCEMKTGWYYINDGNREPTKAFYYGDYWAFHSDSDVKEVLAPVPSYDEWKNITDCFDCEHKANMRLIEENKQLKEELKEICEKYLKIKTTVSAYEDAHKDLHAYIKKLKELLKECESSIQYYQETYGAMDLDTYTLLAKLKEVLR